MALTTTAASATADSYATIAEIEAYLATRDPFPTSTYYTSWQALSTAAKEWRASMAARILDSLHFRGVRATKEQALQFPRIFPGSDLWPLSSTISNVRPRIYSGLVQWIGDATPSDDPDAMWDTWADLVEYADANSLTYPDIPTALKQAQAEVAFQVVHSHLATLGAMEEGSTGVSGLSVGPLSVEFSDKLAPAAAYSIFKSASLDAQSVILFLLHKYMAGLRGALI